MSHQRIGRTGLAASRLLTLWGAAGAAAAAGVFVRHFATGALHPVPLAAAVLAPYGIAYLGVTWAAGVPESAGLAAQLMGRRPAS